MGEGTNAKRIIGFVQHIIDNIGPGKVGHCRCFTTDNLSFYHSMQVTTIIFTAERQLAFRAPCYPVDGPIEYVLNAV